MAEFEHFLGAGDSSCQGVGMILSSKDMVDAVETLIQINQRSHNMKVGTKSSGLRTLRSIWELALNPAQSGAQSIYHDQE